jgi:hypothetical protein
VYAAIGAGAVAYAFALAQRLTRRRLLARAVGAILVVYYPWISLGGYVLSEPPFTLFLCACAFHVLAYADRGRARDAWLFGAALAIGAVFRPQIMAALPLYGLHLLLRRRAYRRLRLRTLVPALVVPFALVAAVSAARMHFHTGKVGFVSNNGPLNFAFGRCHALTISAHAADRKGAYSAPSLGALARREAAHPDSFLRLDPARETKIDFEGYLWDARPLRSIAADCVRQTGPLRQARYALTHLWLLWFYNTTWPDQNFARYRDAMNVAQALHDVFVLPAALAAVALSFWRRRARALLLSLHVLALMAVAVVYFGDTRLRVPYDGILVTLAATSYASAASAIRRWAKERGRGLSPGGHGSSPPPPRE